MINYIGSTVVNWEQKYPEWVTKSGRLKLKAPQHVKQEVFILKCRERHGDTYDYGKAVFTKSLDKVVITCRTHGDFLQTPSSHINTGLGCPKCADPRRKLKTVEQFTIDSKKIHGGLYSYDNVIYVNNATKVLITCKEHGDFEKRPYSHLRGEGCHKCQDRAPSTMVYILTDGNYNKVGITSNLKKRISDIKSRAPFTSLYLVASKECSSENEAKVLERVLHTLPYENPYKSDKFDGYTEWRSIPPLDLEDIILKYGFIR